jgi:deferrochelatase/peroxidase EfeB
MTPNEVDYSDIQGLVRFGFGAMKEARYALLRVKDLPAARAWLRSAPITTAATMDPPAPTALQVAFTAAGLKALEVSPAAVAGFSPEYLAGMTEENRSRRLGDIGQSAPEEWEWGYGSDAMPHLIVMFFAEPGQLAPLLKNSKNSIWEEAFTEIRWLETENLDGIEPFGFADGISQPQIDWEQRRDPTRAEVDYSNLCSLGEFLLGYPNEYNKFTERPLLEPDEQSADLLGAVEAPEKKDLGRNGTYFVLRDLQQDVRAFWQFLNQQSEGDFATAEKLGASFVGRTRAGDPLARVQKSSIPGITPEEKQNQFTFEKDPGGSGCPFGAHIRRANPRNTDFPGRPAGFFARLVTRLGFGPRGFRDDLMSSVRFHRILRRGREYGPELRPEDAVALAPPNDPERGLHFICLNANISRQFEFLQNAWIVNTKFSGLTNESDPLLGTRAPLVGCPATAHFTIEAENHLRRRLSGLPQFVTVRGGAYFFLPSLRALRYFTA